MDKIQQAKERLTASRSYLKEVKAQSARLLATPEIAAWREIDLKEASVPIQMLGVKTLKIEQALTGSAEAGKKIARHITACDNEIGNQLADLLTRPNPEAALNAAENLERKCHEADAMMAELSRHAETMTGAAAAITAALDLEHLIPYARHTVTSSKGNFDSGLAIYTLVSGTETEGENRGLPALVQETAGLAKRFQHAEIPTLPRIAEDIIYHYYHIGDRTTVEVAAFLATVSERVAPDLDTIERLRRRLDDLATRPLPEILTNVRAIAAELREVISGFHHRRQIKENIEAVRETVELLNIFHLALKNKICPELEGKVQAPDSPLNPQVIAAKNTKTFFLGAKGLIRSVKMMVHSLKGSEAINEVELQLILETAINRCKTFYEKTPRDARKMQEFINELVGKYPKPFPYQDLAAIIKETVTAYGNEVVLRVKHCRIKKEFQPLTPVSLPPTMAQLTKKVIGKLKVFKKANAE